MENIQTSIVVQYSASDTKKTQDAVKAHAKTPNKKISDEPYKDLLAFPESGQLLLFKNRKYQVPVYIGINSSRVPRTICVFDMGAESKLILAEVLDPSWIDSICRCDIPDIRRASNTNLKESGTITLHVCIG